MKNKAIHDFYIKRIVKKLSALKQYQTIRTIFSINDYRFSQINIKIIRNISLVITVGVGDLKISNKPGDIIVTHALGSCIGVTVYDPEIQVGGMLHYMLPESDLDRAKAKKTPFMFADTGIPILFRSCYKLGAVKSRMIVKVAGGSSIMDDSGFFNIGKRNYASLRKILWRNNVLIHSEDTGGKGNRTIRLHISNGLVEVKESNKGYRPL